MPHITSAERIGHKRGLQEGLQQGVQAGLQQATQSLVLRHLARRLGALDDEAQARVTALSLEQKEDLSEALLDFTSRADLTQWLDARASKN